MRGNSRLGESQSSVKINNLSFYAFNENLLVLSARSGDKFNARLLKGAKICEIN